MDALVGVRLRVALRRHAALGRHSERPGSTLRLSIFPSVMRSKMRCWQRRPSVEGSSGRDSQPIVARPNGHGQLGCGPVETYVLIPWPCQPPGRTFCSSSPFCFGRTTDDRTMSRVTRPSVSRNVLVVVFSARIQDGKCRC